MAHPNLQTNGASLEDCHTNFFALVTIFVFIKFSSTVPSLDLNLNSFSEKYHSSKLDERKPSLRGTVAPILCV